MAFLTALAALLLLLSPPTPPADGAPAPDADPHSLTATLPASGDDLREARGWGVPTWRVQRRADGGPMGTRASSLDGVAPALGWAAPGTPAAAEGSRPHSERLPYQATAPPLLP